MSDYDCDEIDLLSNTGLADVKLFADIFDVGYGHKQDEECGLNADSDWFANGGGCDDYCNDSNSSSNECSENERFLATTIKQEVIDDNNDPFIDELLARNIDGLIADSANVDMLMDGVIENVVEVDSSHDNMIDDEDEEEAISALPTKTLATAALDSSSNCSQYADENEYAGHEIPSLPLRVEVHHNYCSSKDEVSPSSSANSSPNSRKSSGGNTRGSRSKAITDLTLTEEETRLLSKEGYPNFPRGNVTLTKQEERILRKIRRKMRNKKSAQCSRQRKKEYLDDLERRFDKCNSDNQNLKKENQLLKRVNETLMQKLKQLKHFRLTAISNGQTSFKTSFFVLILSFLFIVFPMFR